MKINDAGLKLIQEFEGCKLMVYKDLGGVLTIGYGHTGGYLHQGMQISKEEALELLKQDIEGFEKDVTLAVKVPLTENQFSALVCLVYNIGPVNFRSSTLLKLLNQNDCKSAADQFIRWNKVNGEVSKGILRRRLAERDLFLS